MQISHFGMVDVVKWQKPKDTYIHCTLNLAYNEKKYAETFLHYRQFFVKGNIIMGEWEIFAVEVSFIIADFLLKATLLLGGVECTSFHLQYMYIDTLCSSSGRSKVGSIKAL